MAIIRLYVFFQSAKNLVQYLCLKTFPTAWSKNGVFELIFTNFRQCRS